MKNWFWRAREEVLDRPDFYVVILSVILIAIYFTYLVWTGLTNPAASSSAHGARTAPSMQGTNSLCTATPKSHSAATGSAASKSATCRTLTGRCPSCSPPPGASACTDTAELGAMWKASGPEMRARIEARVAELKQPAGPLIPEGAAQ